MKKIMFIGSIGCGKTTLCQQILGSKIQYNKTQAVEYYSKMIDTPGEFIQHRRFYNALQMMSIEAEMIGLVANCMEEEQIFSPNFAQNFMKPCIGIITKIDLCNEEQLKEAEQRLQLAGVNKIFKVSALENVGMDELTDYLNEEAI
ncbi:EutP/PduV family microcompartment system protein [Carnobacterium alterfunditum]|uniref:EutP/PduV family microcompartment system protein n=1 Tax=Carnobacterium alterfunditum TaxID=28230 RepID=UPI003593EB98